MSKRSIDTWKVQLFATTTRLERGTLSLPMPFAALTPVILRSYSHQSISKKHIAASLQTPLPLSTLPHQVDQVLTSLLWTRQKMRSNNRKRLVHDYYCLLILLDWIQNVFSRSCFCDAVEWSSTAWKWKEGSWSDERSISTCKRPWRLKKKCQSGVLGSGPFHNIDIIHNADIISQRTQPGSHAGSTLAGGSIPTWFIRKKEAGSLQRLVKKLLQLPMEWPQLLIPLSPTSCMLQDLDGIFNMLKVGRYSKRFFFDKIVLFGFCIWSFIYK